MANKFAALLPGGVASAAGTTTTHDAPAPALVILPPSEQERSDPPQDDIDPRNLPSIVDGKRGSWNWGTDPATGKYRPTFVPMPERPAHDAPAPSEGSALPRVTRRRITTGDDGRRLRVLTYDDGTTTETPIDDEPDITCTDVGNGRRLARDYGDRLQYVPEWGWLAYKDGVWVPGASGEAKECAKACAYDMLREAATTHNDALRKHANASLSNRSIKSMLEMAQSEPGIAASIADFDTDPMLLNVNNGTIDLRTGTLRPHTPQDRITKQAPVTYDPDATAPRWERFLREVFNDNPDTTAFVQRALGYSLTGDVREECYFICYGGGCNGKSTLLNAVMRGILGSGTGRYAKPLKARVLAKQPHGEAAHDAEIMDLVGARFVSAQERLTGEMDTGKMKELVSRDPQQVRAPHSMPITIDPTWKFWICTNERPTIPDATEGTWRRLKLIPFTANFRGREDRTIEAALAAEASGILNWLLDGCKAWQAEGLGDAEAVNAATREYREDQDPTLPFFETVLTRAAPHDRVEGAVAKAAYDRWKEQAGEDAPWLSVKEFYRKAEEHNYRIQRSNGKRYVVGCKLAD